MMVPKTSLLNWPAFNVAIDFVVTVKDTDVSLNLPVHDPC